MEPQPTADTALPDDKSGQLPKEEIEEEGEEQATTGEQEELREGVQVPELKPVAPEPSAASEVALEPKKVIEAALFLSNKPMAFPALALLAKCKVREAGNLVTELASEFDQRASSLRILIENSTARLEVRPEFLSRVAPLSRNLEISRKATRILALIASKNGMMQSELKKYFRGEIYAYVRELKDHEYLISEKRGNSRLLKPTKKFHESFQLASG